ncbi:MAG TPA: hypothetical protein VF145_00180, partial [Chitinophagaceae bacterium]
MYIELHAPYGKVSEAQVTSIRKQLMDLRKLNPRISRAEVHLKQSSTPPVTVNCAIQLSIIGHSMMVNSYAAGFAEAVNQTLRLLLKKVKQQLQADKES